MDEGHWTRRIIGHSKILSDQMKIPNNHWVILLYFWWTYFYVHHWKYQMFHHDSYEFVSWMECTVGTTTLYSISMIKTLIMQHFEIFVASRLKLNLVRKRNLDMLSKQQKTTPKFIWNFCRMYGKEKFLNSIQKRQEINDIHWKWWNINIKNNVK